MEVVTALQEKVTDGKFTESLRVVLDRLKIMQVEWAWGPLSREMLDRLRVDKAGQPDEVAAMIKAITDFAKVDKVTEQAFSTLIKDGHLFHHLHAAHTKERSSITALLLYTILKYNPGATTALTDGNIDSGVNLLTAIKSDPSQIDDALEELALLLIDNSAVGEFLDDLDEHSEYSEIRRDLLIRLTKRSDLTDVLPTTRFIENEEEFYLGQQHEDYLGVIIRYLREGNLEQALLEGTFNPDRTKLYHGIVEIEDTKTDAFFIWLVSGLNAIGRERWEIEFSKESGNLFELILALKKTGTKIDLGIAFQDALSHYKKDFAAGATHPAALEENWTELLYSLKESNRVTFIERVIEEIISSDETAGKLIQLFGESLFECERLYAKSDQLVATGFENFCGPDRSLELEWFTQAVERCPKLVKKAKTAYRDNLKDRTQSLLNDDATDEKTRMILNRLAEHIGLEPVQVEPVSLDDPQDQAD